MVSVMVGFGARFDALLVLRMERKLVRFLMFFFFKCLSLLPAVYQLHPLSLKSDQKLEALNFCGMTAVPPDKSVANNPQTRP